MRSSSRISTDRPVFAGERRGALGEHARREDVRGLVGEQPRVVGALAQHASAVGRGLQRAVSPAPSTTMSSALERAGVRVAGLVHGRFQLSEDEPFGGRLHQPFGRAPRPGAGSATQQDGEPRHPALACEQRSGRAEAAGRFVREASRPAPRP